MEFEATGEPPYVRVKTFTDDDNITVSQSGIEFTLNKGGYMEAVSFGASIFSDIMMLTRMLQGSMAQFLRNYNNKIEAAHMTRIVPEPGWEGYLTLDWERDGRDLLGSGTSTSPTYRWFNTNGTEGRSIQ